MSMRSLKLCMMIIFGKLYTFKPISSLVFYAQSIITVISERNFKPDPLTLTKSKGQFS